MAFWQFSRTATANATADPTINFAEGMPPSAVNDSARALMARLAEFRDDTSGLIIDTGTASAYVVTTFEGIGNPPQNGQRVSWTPANANATNATLAVDGGTAYPILTSSQLVSFGLPAGTLIQGTPVDVTFKASIPAWILKSLFNPSVLAPSVPVPIGSILDYAGATAPSSSFALCFGQAISRATYSALFGLVSTSYGVGDGSTTFNIPDCRGSVVAGLDNMGGVARNVLPGATVLGVFGGEATHLLSTSEMPSHSHAITDPGHLHAQNGATLYNDANPSVQNAAGGNMNNNAHNTASATTGISINTAGGGAAHNNLQPTIALNKILRIL
jgi:microcystin-dependent protein